MRILAGVIVALGLSGCVVADVTTVAAGPGAIVRQYVSPTAFYARHIVIPPGYQTIRLPGIVADPLPSGEMGDTERQTESALAKIAAALQEAGASEADVVAMTVYLVAPPGAAGMDFDGMMRAYSRRYGSAAQPNRPVRSTVEVAGLVRPGMLVEIEVTAAVPATSN